MADGIDSAARDALQRHELTHQAAPTLLQRGGRACSNCAAAKARCSGEIECSRCRQRALPCTYPVVAMPSGTMHHPPAAALQRVSPSANLPPTAAMAPEAAHDEPSLGHGPLEFDIWDHSVLSSTNWLDDAAFLDFPIPHTPESAGFFLHAEQHPAALVHQNNASAAPLSSLPEARRQGLSGSPRSIFTPQSAAVTEGNTSHTSYDTLRAEHGEFYVDGEPSRLPRVKRRKISSSTQITSPETSITRFSLQPIVSHSENEPATFSIEPSAYERIKTLYSQLCVEPPAGWDAFEPAQLPSKHVIDYLVSMYIKHFDESMPFLHPLCVDEVRNHSCLVLAMAAVGSHYANCDESRLLSSSLHEFVRRLLLYQSESGQQEDGGTGFYDRAATLLQIAGMAYSGDVRLQKQALDHQSELTGIFAVACREAESPSFADRAEETTWSSWCRRERTVRQAYCAWLLDCMWTYHFDCRPGLSLADGRLPLPCNNKLWRAGTEEEWKAAHTQPENDISLQEALQQLYVDKQLSPDRCEFARVLIIHGIFHRLWDVERYLTNPLSHWEPTAQRQSSEEMLPQSPIWLPGNQAFTRWQNSTCDCLDVLHWQANAKIGRASGLEHPTVLHLHLARVVLLTPFRDIASLARAMTQPSATCAITVSTAKHLVQRWAIQHQYKARLAAVHAGVLFWHVRRYSIDAFYEAPAVGLAALVLWAFGSFANCHARSRAASRPHDGQQRTDGAPTSREESDQSDEGACSIILLDRPTDDELVQQFIRNGHAMQAHLSGIGDLYAAKGPERVLGQGLKLLSSLKCWGVGTKWLQLLEDLHDAVRKGRTKG